MQIHTIPGGSRQKAGNLAGSGLVAGDAPGGGSYGGKGGRPELNGGTDDWGPHPTSGKTYGNINLEALLAGSGGGAGSVEAGSGGGGAIKITAGGKLIVGKNIYANGGMGMADSTNDAAKSGAGGSGGAIYLKASDLVINSGVSIRADGGPGAPSCHRRKQLCHRWWWYRFGSWWRRTGIPGGTNSFINQGSATNENISANKGGNAKHISFPQGISGLKMWLDAADTSSITKSSSNKVSQWNDKSGNNRHVTQSGADSIKPTLSSDSIAFNGSQYLFNNTPFMYNNGSIEIYIVASGNTQNDKRLINEGSSASNNPLYGFNITNQSPQNRLAVYFRNDGNTAMRSQAAIVNDVAMDGSYKILNWKDTGSSIIASVNGGATGSLSYSRSGTMSTNRFCVGGILRSSFSYGFSGNIKELIISSPMSNADSQKVESYLARKWGLSVSTRLGEDGTVRVVRSTG